MRSIFLDMGAYNTIFISEHTNFCLDIIGHTLESIRNLSARCNTHGRTICLFNRFFLICFSCGHNIMNTRCHQIKNQVLSLKVDSLIILQFHTSSLDLYKPSITYQTIFISFYLISLLRKLNQSLFCCQIQNACTINNNRICSKRLTICI